MMLGLVSCPSSSSLLSDLASGVVAEAGVVCCSSRVDRGSWCWDWFPVHPHHHHHYRRGGAAVSTFRSASSTSAPLPVDNEGSCRQHERRQLCHDDGRTWDGVPAAWQTATDRRRSARFLLITHSTMLQCLLLVFTFFCFNLHMCFWLGVTLHIHDSLELFCHWVCAESQRKCPQSGPSV